MRASLLDRLTDWDDESLDADLSALLNTRRAEYGWESVYEQAAKSILTYGIVDFTGYNLNSSVDRERVRRSIERAIRQFEPRLTRVEVTLEQAAPFDPVLSLSIQAEWQAEEAALPLQFRGTLGRASRRFALRKERA